MAKILYNTIGTGYDTTRNADPEIVKSLIRLLDVKEGKRYLDAGCGSGNYTDALFTHGIDIQGFITAC